MTQAENNKYYQEYLVNLNLTSEQIHILLTQYPIGKIPVRPDDRKEGSLVEGTNYRKGEKVLLLYRTEGGWVGISSYNKIVCIDGKYFTRKYYKFSYPERHEILNFIKQHFPIPDAEELIGAKASAGERLLAQALEKMGYTEAFVVKSEYQIPDLIGFNNLWVRSPRYDFAILDNEKPLMFLEFDGEQHYKPSEDFLCGYRRDVAKNAYAFYKGIPLIRFPKGILQETNNIDEVAKTINIFLDAGRFCP